MSILGKVINSPGLGRLARLKNPVSKAAIRAWLDERIGFSHPLNRLLNFPVPRYAEGDLLYALGGLTGISLLLQIVTGVLLTFYYTPSPDAAYNSSDYVTYSATWGWLIRGLHYYNVSALIILTFLHLLRTFFFSAYKKPREVTWLTGVALFIVTLIFAFTGQLLPWDQSGYWASKVGIEIAGSAPIAGNWVAQMLRGAEVVGQATLTRFYILHTALLPVILIALIGFHLIQVGRHGIAPSITKRGQALAGRFVPVFPNYLGTVMMLGLGLIVVLIVFSVRQRAPLDFPADPTSADYIPRPEWYFLSLYELLKYFPGAWKSAIVLIPVIVLGSLVILPFVDKSAERRPWRKPVATTIALVYLTGIVGLTLLALRD